MQLCVFIPYSLSDSNALQCAMVEFARFSPDAMGHRGFSFELLTAASCVVWTPRSERVETMCPL